MSAETQQRHQHEVLFFTSSEQLLRMAVPFLQEGGSSDDDIVLICTDHHIQALVEALGHGARVTVLPPARVYQKAITAVACYGDTMRELLRAGGQRVRLVGEVDFGTGSRALQEWRRFEALCNPALAMWPLWSVCAYDAQALPDEALATGQLTHPYLRQADGPVENPGFRDPAELLCPTASRPPPRGAAVTTTPVTGVPGVRGFRHELRALLRSRGVEDALAEELELAVTEVVSNGVRHGVPPVTVSVWVSPEGVECAVTDHGPGFDDPFAGFSPPGGALPTGGLGLWVARRLTGRGGGRRPAGLRPPRPGMQSRP